MTSWTVACQAPLAEIPVGFPRQEYWNGLPFPSPGDLPDLGVEPASLALAGGFFTIEANTVRSREIFPQWANPVAIGNKIRVMHFT